MPTLRVPFRATVRVVVDTGSDVAHRWRGRVSSRRQGEVSGTARTGR